MAQGKNSSKGLHGRICEIPLKLPSCNEYINECRRNMYAGAKMKKDTEYQIGFFLKKLAPVDKPCIIHFTWIEKHMNRDADGIAFGKKFILDEMVNLGILMNDNRKWVRGYTDEFRQGGDFKVIVEVEVLDEEHSSN